MQYYQQVIIGDDIYINPDKIEKINISIDNLFSRGSKKLVDIIVWNLDEETISKIMNNNFWKVRVIHYYKDGSILYFFNILEIYNYSEDYFSSDGDLRSIIQFKQKCTKLEVEYFPNDFKVGKNSKRNEKYNIIEKAKLVIPKIEKKIEDANNNMKKKIEDANIRRAFTAEIIDLASQKTAIINEITSYIVNYSPGKIDIMLIGIITKDTPSILRNIKNKNLNEEIKMSINIGKIKFFDKEKDKDDDKEAKKGVIDLEMNVIKYDEKYDIKKNMKFFTLILEY